MSATDLLVARWVVVNGAPHAQADVPSARELTRFAHEQFNLVISEALAVRARSSLWALVS
jgi:hypothetical protein